MPITLSEAFTVDRFQRWIDADLIPKNFTKLHFLPRSSAVGDLLIVNPEIHKIMLDMRSLGSISEQSKIQLDVKEGFKIRVNPTNSHVAICFPPATGLVPLHLCRQATAHPEKLFIGKMFVGVESGTERLARVYVSDTAEDGLRFRMGSKSGGYGIDCPPRPGNRPS